MSISGISRGIFEAKYYELTKNEEMDFARQNLKLKKKEKTLPPSLSLLRTSLPKSSHENGV